MLAQEKEEHKFDHLSRVDEGTAKKDDDAKNEDCPLLGQPARLQGEGRIGWDEDTLYKVSVQSELEDLYDRVSALQHQVKVYEGNEKTRLQESEDYRLKLLEEDRKEQERLATVEPTPLLLTRGAHIGTTPLPLTQNRVHIDWISFTAKETSDTLKQFANIHIEGLRFEIQKKGMAGYKSVTNISKDGEQIGLIGYGSPHGKNLLTLTGKGCAFIKDWNLFRQWLEILDDFAITRLDLALDFYMGEMTHDKVIEGYNLEKFKALQSSKNPSISIQQSVDGMGRNRGRTIKIGGRNSSKFIRCYEKGLERFAKLYSSTTELNDDQVQFFFKSFDCHDIDENVPEGTSILNWYRLEVQFGNADRVLSTEMLSNRDPFFAGAYPFCKEVMEMEETKKPDRIPNNLETDIEVMFKHIREQYGSFLTTMLASGMTQEEVLKKCVNGKISQRIVKAGGLSIIKPFDPKMFDKT